MVDGMISVLMARIRRLPTGLRALLGSAPDMTWLAKPRMAPRQ